MSGAAVTCLIFLTLTVGRLDPTSATVATEQSNRVHPSGAWDRAIAAVMPRVVKLYGLGAGRQAGYGTGVMVSEDGLVLTVFSLLIDARRIRAVMEDGTQYGADVVRRDPSRQLALLRIRPMGAGDEPVTDVPMGAFPYFDLSHDTTLTPSDWVLSAGNAFKVADGAEPVSLAHGVFSIRTRLDAHRRLKDFPYRGDVLVIDAITSNPGAPGSALVNLDGAFVGMIGRVVQSNLTHTHFNYAIPRDVLYDFFVEATAPTIEVGHGVEEDARATTIATGQHEPPFDPGIRLNRLGYQRVLPFVERVRSDSPAQRAGVRKDDLILSLNGRSIADASAYHDQLRRLAPGEALDLVIRRGRIILTVHIEPEEP